MAIEITRRRDIFLIRLLVILIICYLTVFGPIQAGSKVWPYLFIAFYLSTNLLLLRIPDRLFTDRTIFRVMVFFDSCMVAAGMYLSGRAGAEFYMVYFIIIGLACMSISLRYLMINTIVFACLYGWFLYKKGMFMGDMAVSYALRLPFMVVIALFFGYVVETIVKDKDRSLRESEERYRSLVESTDDSVYMVSKDCTYLSGNNKLLTELGVSAKEIVGKTFADFHSPEETERFASKVNQVLKTKEAVRYETYNSNLRKWFMLTLSPIKDPATGRVTSVSVLSKDITERMHIEGKLRKAYNELKKTQDQLIQSAKMSAVGRLASGVAHQIRNPLGIIVMGVEFLSEELPAKSLMLSECMDKIKEASNRTNKIVTDFFQFSRTSEFELKSVDLCRVLDDAIILMDHRLIVNNVEIRKDYPGLPVGVHADKNTLQQAFINLFANAVDAMPEGGKVRISVRPERIEANRRAQKGKKDPKTNGQMTVIEIEDTGKGIPLDVLPKIFEPFFTTKYSGQGTGLGLSTVHAIVQRHHGTIDVKSVVDKGTTFTVKLHTAHNPILEV